MEYGLLIVLLNRKINTGKGIINFDVEKTNELLAYVAQIKEDGINIDAPKDGNLYGQKDGEWEQAQEQLESGKNIKTLNGVSVLGEGNIDIAPTIGENGNWYINGLDTGKPAKGNDGADGVSLGEIALVQETGTGSGSENKVMSQAAVTKEVNGIDEKINNRTTEYNVSVNHPTSGTDGTNRYDLTGAIAQVPAELRTAGLTISFLNESGDTEKWEFSGSSWVVSNFSQVGSEKIRKIGLQLNKKANIEDSPLSQNLLDVEGVNWVGGGYIGINGTDIQSNSDYSYSENYQEISYLAGKTVYGNVYKISVYDSDKNFIEDLSLYNGEKKLPINAFYWRASTWCTKTSNEEIRNDLLGRKSYVSLSNLGSNADVYKGRKIITDKYFQVTNEQMPKDYEPNFKNNSIAEEKLTTVLQDKINNKLNKSIGKNLCMHEECLLNQYMNDQGKIISADGYALTGLIPIRNGQILRCNQQYIVSYNGLYDKNRQIIKSSLVQASSQQYLVGTEESAFAQFSFGVDKLSTLMVEEVDSIEGVSSEYEPYTEKNKILNVLGFNEEINHPMLTKQFSFFNKTWMAFCDSFGITGSTMGGKTNTLFVRKDTYGYRTTEQGYTWHRYISDYLQLGGLINDAVSGSCISNAYIQFSPFCTRVDSIQSDESVALAILEGGTNDWYYNVPIGDNPVLFGTQDGANFNEFDENTLNKDTFKTAFAYVLLKMQKLYPNAIVVAVTPIYAARLCNGYEYNEPGYNEAGKNKLGNTLLDYVDAEIEVAGMLGIPVIDGYRTSGINCGNWKKYISDGVHPWVSDGAGLKMYGRMIIGGLQKIFSILPEIPKPE